MSKLRNSVSLLSLTVAFAAGLGGCAVQQRLSEVGRAPDMTPMAVMGTPNPEAPYAGTPYAAAPQAPLPAQQSPQNQAAFQTASFSNSLWRPGARSFFRDPRASRIGDILTVQIAIGDEAKIDNSTSRSRKAASDSSLTNFLGLESELKNVLPEAVDPSALTKLGGDTSTAGTGSVNRSEDIKLTVAAVVTQVLPNGNLIIQGHQEVRVNYELRELTISGIVRPEDITNANTISQTQIAEARISYGGRGQISDVQQPGLGQQVYDIISPF